VFQFNKIGGYDVTPENVTGCDFMQQLQKGTYPDAILQVCGLFAIFFVFSF
jgi:hypothetical protein